MLGQWQSTPVLLPGKSHGQRSLVGCSPWVAKNRARLSNFTFTFHFHALEKEMATHSNILAWRIPGTEQPGGLWSMGSHRVRHDWSDLAAAEQLTELRKPIYSLDYQVIVKGNNSEKARQKRWGKVWGKGSELTYSLPNSPCAHLPGSSPNPLFEGF